MSTSTKIPYGDNTLKVELTVKELMAITGVRFPNNHSLEISARKKINEALADAYEQGRQEKDSIPYQLLT
ncbi:hypothetical protein D3C80_1818510 [compost metagenome]